MRKTLRDLLLEVGWKRGVFSLAVLITLGVVVFDPGLLGGVISGTPIWVKVLGIIALLPVLHSTLSGLGPVLHPALPVLVSFLAATLRVLKRRSRTVHE